MSITHFFDYKSPYAYLAQADVFQLADDFSVNIEFRPYTLDIPSYLGAAELDAEGEDTIKSRNAHQWRRVKYSYMDCRREANRKGLVVRGPRKIFDSSLAHIGFYFATAQGDFRPYHNHIFEKFWKRELDIEDVTVLSNVLAETGYDTTDFSDYLVGPGRELHDRIQTENEARGVFGVPSLLVDDELFWGTERIERVRERLVG